MVPGGLRGNASVYAIHHIPPREIGLPATGTPNLETGIQDETGISPGTIINIIPAIIWRTAENGMDKPVELNLLGVKDLSFRIGTKEKLDPFIAAPENYYTIIPFPRYRKILLQVTQKQATAVPGSPGGGNNRLTII